MSTKTEKAAPKETAQTSKETTRKRGINVLPKKPLTERELKAIVNEKYAESNMYYKIVKEAVENMTNHFKKQITDIIDFADSALELVITTDESGKKNYTMNFNLTDQELEFLAIKIPTVCLYVQEHINNRALDTSIAEYLMEDAVTEHLKDVTGGDAKERLRFAQQKAEVEFLVSLVKKQVYANLKTYVDRADKIYEGVKKVIDGKNKEKYIFNKMNK